MDQGLTQKFVNIGLKMDFLINYIARSYVLDSLNTILAQKTQNKNFYNFTFPPSHIIHMLKIKFRSIPTLNVEKNTMFINAEIKIKNYDSNAQMSITTPQSIENNFSAQRLMKKKKKTKKILRRTNKIRKNKKKSKLYSNKLENYDF